MGAWIEIFLALYPSPHGLVAPYMGAWIEMCMMAEIPQNGDVAPYMGAWIEIGETSLKYFATVSRSLYGGVD